MQTTNALASEEQHYVLSNQPPSQTQKRLAVGVVLGLIAALYLVVGPFGGMQLHPIHSFVAFYTTAMFVTDSITAIILYGQFSILRSRAILLIASGYLFTALIIIPYTLAFPGVVSPNGVFGGLQTTAQLYLIWHCGFPLFVIAYALSKDEDEQKRISQLRIRLSIINSVAWTFLLAAVATFICINFETVLPRIMLDQGRFVTNWLYVVGAPIALLCTVAIVILWFRRRSILDICLLVVLCAYLVEIPPHYFPSPARFSTGWYAVRVTSILSSSVVLIVLLYEISMMYGGLLNAVLGQRRERDARLITGDAVAASIAHEIRQPLTAMVTTADAGLRYLDRPFPNLDRAKEAFKRISTDGHRAGEVVGSIRANFKSDVKDRVPVDLNELIRDALAMGVGELQKNRILVQVRLNEHLSGVRGNRVQLQQVLLNLIINAADAMAGKDGPRILSVNSEAQEGGRVLVSVADNGVGIFPQDADRMFDPLFTTKSDGMGMGLSICRAIIEAHEGRFWYSPNTPEGAVFQFTLLSSNPAFSSG